MIGELPKTLTVDGKVCPINSDYRAALTIFEAFGDKELSELNKSITLLEIIYDFSIPESALEAQKQAELLAKVEEAAAKKGVSVESLLESVLK